MSDDVARVAAGLSGYDVDQIASAWQGASGRWHINGRCKPLYADGICSLSGVLTDFGNRLRQHLLSNQENGRGE